MNEVTVKIAAIKLIEARASNGVLAPLADSILRDGLRHPVTLWTDGTLISGGRRVRTHLVRPGMPQTVRAIFVDTIEAAAKRLLIDNQDEHLSEPMKPSDICRLWDVLRQLDEPAAVKRASDARRRGVELRRAVLRGERKPGRNGYSNDYVLQVLGEPFGMSERTATRLYTLHRLTTSADPRAKQAALAIENIDSGRSTIWANYSHVIRKKTLPAPHRPAPAVIEAAPAARQLAAWERTLPQMEGLTAGLVALGPPADGMTWDQVGPAHARLSAIRRDLEKIIKKMKEHKA